MLVRRHPILVPLALRSIIAHVAGSFYGVLYTIYLVDDLHLSPVLLGIVISAGGVGALAGSVVASRVDRPVRPRAGAHRERDRRFGHRRPHAARRWTAARSPR